MTDLVLLASVVASFTLAAEFVRSCKHLVVKSPQESRR
jgi:hypothetical protein